MTCCGSKRKSLKRQTPPPATKRAAPPPLVFAPQPQSAPPQVLFRNTANANISVRGPISGETYFFLASGPAIPVDQRDVPFLSTISRLQPSLSSTAKPAGTE